MRSKSLTTGKLGERQNFEPKAGSTYGCVHRDAPTRLSACLRPADPGIRGQRFPGSSFLGGLY